MKILVLGKGLLGNEIIDKTGWDYLSRKDHNFDITDINKIHNISKDYTHIINCIAFTDTYSTDKEKHWNVNYKSVSDLVDFCNENNIKLIHISTDYLYSNSKTYASEEDVPVHCGNWYGYTKLLADGHIQLKSENYLLIRTTHKPYPFPYKKALVEQIGNFDYVNVIVDIIIKLIRHDVSGVYNVGTDVKTMYELAKKSDSDVEPLYDMMNDTTPKNVIMNIEKITKFLNVKT
jgi:dTDP-4-dehydrorhamnose reductase